MERRGFLAGTAATVTALTAGCTALTSITGNSKNCSDRGIPIDDIDRDSDGTVTVSGRVTKTNDSDQSFVVDDGTAKAIVGAPPMPSKGDCVVVRGDVSGCYGAGCEDDEYYLDPARLLDTEE